MPRNYITNGVLGGVMPVLAISGAGAATIKSTNTVLVKIDGVISSIAAATLAAIPATVTVPLLSTSVVAVYVNAAGTATYTQGATVLNTAIAANTIYPFTSNLPEDVPGKALIGWMVIKTAAAVTFTGGTTLLDAVNLTVTYVDKPANGIY